MNAADQLRACHNTTGTAKYLLRLEVADLGTIKFFHTEVLRTVRHANAITTFMGSPKNERA